MPKLRAVVVEDDVNLGGAFKTVLELCGFEVAYIDDSETTMAKVMDVQPALVMLDLQMPKVSGLDLVQSIGGNDIICRTKVIMLTANRLRFTRRLLKQSRQPDLAHARLCHPDTELC